MLILLHISAGSSSHSFKIYLVITDLVSISAMAAVLACHTTHINPNYSLVRITLYVTMPQFGVVNLASKEPLVRVEQIKSLEGSV